MVNTSRDMPTDGLGLATKLVGVYVVVVLATIVTLAILSGVDSGQATQDAWGHAVVVGVFAVVLPVRLRAARRGSRSACVAVSVIATVLLAVNLVEALIPGFLPAWMRIEMIGIAALMAAVAVLVLRGRPR
jgi:hypothetical protein